MSYSCSTTHCTNKSFPTGTACTHANFIKWHKCVFVCRGVFVVRQNRWADVAAVVITLGHTRSQVKFSQAASESWGKTQASEQQGAVAPQRCHTERLQDTARMCWGKSRSSQSKVIKPNHKERQRECKWRLQRRETKRRRIIVRGITDNTCCFYAVSQPFEGVSAGTNFARQMFLLLLIQADLKRGRCKIRGGLQMVTLRTPNLSHLKFGRVFFFFGLVYFCFCGQHDFPAGLCFIRILSDFQRRRTCCAVQHCRDWIQHPHGASVLPAHTHA